MHLTIRADGGHDIGYGHLVRSGAIAEELLARGQTVTVATMTHAPACDVFPAAVETVDLPARGDPDPFVAWLEAASPDVVFTDAYPIDTAYQRAVRERVTLAVMQDDARHAICADLFVNGNLYAPDLDYQFEGQNPITCLGAEFVLLRSEIRDWIPEDRPWRDHPNRALITMGGSDPANLTPTIVGAFDGYDLQLDVIVGPGFSDDQEREIRTRALEISVDCNVTRDPMDLPERLLRADFAVSTSSSTTYELLALGTPIISVPVADNQELIAKSLHDRNLALVLEPDAGTEHFRSAIDTYVTNPSVRKKHRERGRELVDGRGTERVCTELISLVAENHDVS